MIDYLITRKEEIESLTYNDIDNATIKEYLDIISCLINLNIYNQTFRQVYFMGDFIKRVAIGVAIGMSLFFLKTQVFATTGDGWGLDLKYDGTLAGRVGSNGVNPSGATYVFTPPGSTSNYSEQYINYQLFTGSSTVIGVGANYAYKPFYLYSVTYYLCGSYALNSYTEIFGSGGTLSDFTSSVSSHYLFSSISGGGLSTNVFGDGAFASSCRSFTHSFVFNDDSSSYGWSGINMRFSNSNSRTTYILGVDIVPQGLSTEFYSSTSFSTVLRSALNTVVQQPIEDQTDEIMNTDAPADNTYNNDYSTSSFDTSSASVNQHTNTDVSSFNLDSSNYSSSWSWLWSTLESFIANIKVFTAYIFMLTLGFIALVLGR